VKHLPRLEWEDYSVRRVKKHKGDSTDYELKIRYRNSGKLPTALSQAHLVKIVRPDEVRLTIDTVSGVKPLYRILDPAPAPRRREAMMMYDEELRAPAYISRSVGYTPGGAVGEALFRIRVFGSAEIKGKARVVTTRAGILTEKEFIIK